MLKDKSISGLKLPKKKIRNKNCGDNCGQIGKLNCRESVTPITDVAAELNMSLSRCTKISISPKNTSLMSAITNAIMKNPIQM